MMETTKSIIDYLPQIIGLIGTISGTILGWLLSYMTGNLGKVKISVDSFQGMTSNKGQYAYIIKLFLYNASAKPRYIRNIKILFCDKKGKKLIESYPIEGQRNFHNIPHTKGDDCLISLNGHTPNNVTFAALVDEEECKLLVNTKKIYLIYEFKTNKTKKIKINNKFCISSVQASGWDSF